MTRKPAAERLRASAIQGAPEPAAMRYDEPMSEGKQFLESRDDPDDAWGQARAYAVILSNDSNFAGWTVSVSKIVTPQGDAYAIYLFPPKREEPEPRK